MYNTKVMPEVRKKRVLHDVSLELTYKCNLDCFFCYNDRDKQGAMLSLQQYRVLLEGLAQMQTLYLMLTGGEPMVHPHFFEIGRMAKDLGFAVRIRTNGHSLSKKNVARLVTEVDPYYVEVSLHGATAEVHDKQTRISGSFDRLLNSISNCHEQGIDIRAISTPTLWNEHQIDEMIQLCDEIGVVLQFQGPVAPRDNGDLTPLQISPKPETWDKVHAYYQTRKLTAKSLPVSNKSIEVKLDSISRVGEKNLIQEEASATCSVGVASVDIDPYGNVQACMHLQESAGNLHDHSIKDIWYASPLFLRARERAIEAATQFENKEKKQLGSSVYCLAVEENLAKGGYDEDFSKAPMCS